jgi:hypothetical protein
MECSPCLSENTVEHRPSQFASERVLLAWVIRADQSWTVGETDGKTVAKFRARFGNNSAAFPVGRKKSVESDLTQYNNDFDSGEQFDFLHQIGTAAEKLDQTGFVVRRRAAYRRRYIAIVELETVVFVTGVRLIGKSGAMQGAVKPITAAIARKHSTGPIAAMGRRCKPDNQNPRAGIAETGKRSCPIFFCAVPSRRFCRNRFAPAHETGTAAATDNFRIELLECSHPMTC